MEQIPILRIFILVYFSNSHLQSTSDFNFQSHKKELLFFLQLNKDVFRLTQNLEQRI